jgi:hypothetical protein
LDFQKATKGAREIKQGPVRPGNGASEKSAATIAMAKPDVKSGFKGDTLATYTERGILGFTYSVSIVFACLLPVIAITVLSEVHGQGNLSLCLTGFAVLFAVGLINLGTGSRIELFGATVA